MAEETRDNTVCPACDTTIFKDSCRCDEENMKLYHKLVADDRRIEADLIQQGEMEAKFEMLLETCWYNLNGLAYVEARALKAGVR